MIAKEKSTDIISRNNGGELGWLEPETTPDEVKAANLSEKGQLSDVIKSSVGYLIVRLNDIKPELVKPLSEVHDELAKKLKQEKALDAYYALQQKSMMRQLAITNLWLQPKRSRGLKLNKQVGSPVTRYRLKLISNR